MKEFKEIIKDLEAGKKIYRKFWVDPVGRTPKYIYSNFGDISDNENNKYTLNLDDIIATDWIVKSSILYEFSINIRGRGKNKEEAWQDAIQGFQDDPGSTPEDNSIIE